jgi:hypothetical protein
MHTHYLLHPIPDLLSVRKQRVVQNEHILTRTMLARISQCNKWYDKPNLTVINRQHKKNKGQVTKGLSAKQ